MNDKNIDFGRNVRIIRDRMLPEDTQPVGYAALIAAYDLDVPPPHLLSAVRADYRAVEVPDWTVYTKRHAPEPSLAGHLTFALKYEGVDLLVLKSLFRATGPAAIEEFVTAAPTSQYARRAWFLYEWLLGEAVDLPDALTGNYVDAIDETQQLAGRSRNSRRHRVRDNLPGTPAFCPLVFRTPGIEALLKLDLKTEAAAAIGSVPRDTITRAAAFLLLNDSRASYAIEGERPPQDRIQRWGVAIGQAGDRSLSHAELLRLQELVLGDTRFVHKGYRNEGGFVGTHDRVTRAPIPDHVSARPEDLPALMDGLLAFDDQYASSMDAIVAAAVLAFGFVYIHPFEDGNGRLHRYLIHHALARAGFNPPGLVFPISSAILEHIEAYRRVLESHSRRILPFVDWRATPAGNVDVQNDTADLYRYFDATPHAEFLMSCVRQTIETDLPREVAFLRSYDRFKAGVEALVEMPDKTIDLLYHFLSQNDGRLSKRAREGEFASLTAPEVEKVESVYSEAFGGD
tara:strand:+ start:23139 stop:24680 length:1542 start_codon:yes stop_codon:yes gene_type:complete